MFNCVIPAAMTVSAFLICLLGALVLGEVDAVIMNGGMSRFYMVINRLKKFFGFDPIVALDPDQAVARGAAVYHYFLHKYDKELAEEIQDNMSNSTRFFEVQRATKNFRHGRQVFFCKCCRLRRADKVQFLNLFQEFLRRR